MTEPNSSTTVPDKAPSSRWDNADLVQKCDLLLLRLKQRQGEQALKRSRCEAIYGDLRSAESTGSSSNTKLSAAVAATPKDNGDPSACFRRGPLRDHVLEQCERCIKMKTPPVRGPHIPRSSMNSERPDAAITARGASSAYIAFGLPYPPPRQTPPFNPNRTHPRMWSTVTSTLSGDNTPGATHACSTEMRLFDAYLKHRNAEAIDLSSKPVNGTPSNLAAREASREAQTGASGMAGPGKVGTTVTRTSQSTMSASEIFWEVRECCVEYLGSYVER